MRKDIGLRGHRDGLRPVQRSVAAFIGAVRTEGGRFLHPGATTVSEQNAWLDSYFARDGDYYFVIDDESGAPQGLAAIYDVDVWRGTAEWGRLVVRPGSLAAVSLRSVCARVLNTTT